MHLFRKRIGLALAASAMGVVLASSPAQAQDRYIGEIMQTGYTFCPRGTAGLDGQLLAISQNDALFSLIGTIYGGDGRTTFGLPDCAAVCQCTTVVAGDLPRVLSASALGRNSISC